LGGRKSWSGQRRGIVKSRVGKGGGLRGGEHRFSAQVRRGEEGGLVGAGEEEQRVSGFDLWWVGQGRQKIGKRTNVWLTKHQCGGGANQGPVLKTEGTRPGSRGWSDWGKRNVRRVGSSSNLLEKIK